MILSSLTTGFSGSFIFTFLLLLISINAAPISPEVRGGGGPKFCGVPLKLSNYRNVCLGTYDPMRGQTVSLPLQPGLASNNAESPLTWLQSVEMAQLQKDLGADFSGVHCDHVLEVQYISLILQTASSVVCPKLPRDPRLKKKALGGLLNVVNGKGNLLLLDGEINKLKGRYTTRVMTSIRNKVDPVLPAIEDTWLLKGVRLYFSRIGQQQVEVAGNIWNTIDRLSPGALGTKNMFLATVEQDFSTLNTFFQKAFSAHPDASGWITPSSEVSNQISTETLSLMEAELQASFELDDEDQEPLTPRQIRHLERNARLAASTQNPPKSAQAQCKRFLDSETDSNGGPACELPNRTGLQSAVNNNTNLNHQVGTLPASSLHLLPSAPIFSEPELESSTFFRSYSSPPAALPSSKSVLGNLNRPVASSVPTFVTQHRTPLRASPTILSSFRQSPVNHFYSVSKSPIYYPRPIPTRVRAGRILTTRVGLLPSSTKMKSPFSGRF